MNKKKPVPVTKEEKQFIKENFYKLGIAGLAKKFNRSMDTMRNIVRRLGLSKMSLCRDIELENMIMEQWRKELED